MSEGYSIFSHAQLGHLTDVRHKPTPGVITSVDGPGFNQSDDESPAVSTPRRTRPERGWAVEMGLGLGNKFNKKRKP